MYRNGDVYNSIIKTIIEIYIDYDIKGFPVDEREVCKKLGVALVSYSAFDKKDRELFMNFSEYAFFDRIYSKTPTIYYNDFLESVEAQRFSVFHELKHYVFEDTDDENDDLADFFARYFMCPIPYMLLKNIDTPNEIVSFCGLSITAAKNACENIHKRRRKYGYELFSYEVPLIKHLDPVLIEVYFDEGGDCL